MKIKLEELVEILKFLDDINNNSLGDLEITLDGREIVIPHYTITEWKFTGLSTLDFLKCYINDNSLGE